MLGQLCTSILDRTLDYERRKKETNVLHGDDHLVNLTRLVHLPGVVGGVSHRGQKHRESGGSLHRGDV